MIAIKNYTDTKYELHVAQSRLTYLIDKKETIYCRYNSVTSTIKEVNVQSGHNHDKMSDYVNEMNKIDPITGMSLEQEIQLQQKEVNTLKTYLTNMETNLKEMQGIEYKLYYEIVVNGRSVSRAVEKVAMLHSKDTSTIWKYYYPKIAKEIKKLKL